METTTIYIRKSENATEKQLEIKADFTSITELKDTVFLYSIDGTSIYAMCTDGVVKISENNIMALRGNVVAELSR